MGPFNSLILDEDNFEKCKENMSPKNKLAHLFTKSMFFASSSCKLYFLAISPICIWDKHPVTRQTSCTYASVCCGALQLSPAAAIPLPSLGNRTTAISTATCSLRCPFQRRLALNSLRLFQQPSWLLTAMIYVQVLE